MKYGQELKVGLALVLSVAAIIFGVRFFEGLPLFGGTSAYSATFANGDGLAAGSPVRVSGVNVGKVESVALDPATRRVRVTFRVDDALALTRGTTAKLGGFSALGGIRVDLLPGPAGAPALPGGAEIPSTDATDLVAEITDRAPLLAARADTLLLGAGLTVGEAYRLLGDEDSDLRLALASLRQSTNALNTLIRAQDPRFAAVLGNANVAATEFGTTAVELRGLATDFRGLTATNRDSIALAVANLNASLRRLDRGLVGVEASTARFDTISARVARGEGNLGLLLNDSTLYVRLDSTLNTTNGILDDFKRNPGRYLRHLKLVDVF